MRDTLLELNFFNKLFQYAVRRVILLVKSDQPNAQMLSVSPHPESV